MSDDLDRLGARARDDLTRAVNDAAPEAPPAANVTRRAGRRIAHHVVLASVLIVGSAGIWLSKDDGPPSKVVAGQPEGTATTTTGLPAVALDTEGPPPISLRAEGRTVEIRSYAFCWSPADRGQQTRQSLCADGRPDADPSHIGITDVVELTVPWASGVTAYRLSPGDPCSRPFPVPVERGPDGAFRLRPAGYPGESDVHLSAKGPNGSAEFLFRWQTTLRGPLPPPSARTSISDRAEGTPLNGIELAIDQLARTPDDAKATVKVTAANGRSTTLEAVRSPNTCRPEGSVYWDRITEGTVVPGPAPFRYDVTVILDGVTHRASATWPDDQIVGYEPNVALKFEPPLPGLS